MYQMLFKPQTLKLLGLLLAEERSLKDLSKAMGFSKSNLLQKYMGPLERMDIVERTYIRTRDGREVRYKVRPFTLVLGIAPDSRSAISFVSGSVIDMNWPLVQQVDADFRDDLRKMLDGLSERDALKRTVVVLYGSVAKGKGAEKSDIDVLFLTDDAGAKDRTLTALSDISLELSHAVSPMFAVKNEFLDDKRMLAKEIRKDGIILYGEMREDGAIWHQMMRYSNITFSA